MRHFQANKIKAFCLLSVFSLNTVVGFACSVGLDMGFNSKHHHDEESTEAVVHVHSDGKKHIHYEKKNTHEHNNPHQHDQDKTHHNSNEEKDNCCNDQVLKFEQADKSIPHSLNIVHPLFLIAFLDVFYNVNLPSPGLVKDIKQFVRNYHPPIADIRIAIRSFQI
jgi:hypothetical protein